MTDIFDKKDLDDYDKELQKIINYFQISGTELQMKGSSVYKNLNYRSDIDIFVLVPPKLAIHDVFNKLKAVLEKIHLDDDVYFIELKLQTKDKDKIRFYSGESLSFTDFEKSYAKLDFFQTRCSGLR